MRKNPLPDVVAALAAPERAVACPWPRPRAILGAPGTRPVPVPPPPPGRLAMSARATFLVRSLPILLVAAPLAAQKQSDPLAGLDVYIEKAMKDWGVAGLGVSIVRHDSVIFAKGFGVRDVNKPE